MSDWSSDVCSSDLLGRQAAARIRDGDLGGVAVARDRAYPHLAHRRAAHGIDGVTQQIEDDLLDLDLVDQDGAEPRFDLQIDHLGKPGRPHAGRSEEHTSELQSLMRTSYAVFCLKKKTK